MVDQRHPHVAVRITGHVPVHGCQVLFAQTAIERVSQDSQMNKYNRVQIIAREGSDEDRRGDALVFHKDNAFWTAWTTRYCCSSVTPKPLGIYSPRRAIRSVTGWCSF